MIRTNEGFADRVLRVVGGVALLSLLALAPVPGWGLVGLIGLIGVVTGVVGYCPPYTLLGIDTLKGWPRKTREVRHA